MTPRDEGPAGPRSSYWTRSWAAGAAVVGVAAGLLVTLILLGRRIAALAAEISSGLERVAGATDSLWDVVPLNAKLRRIVRAVGGPAADSAPASAAHTDGRVRE